MLRYLEISGKQEHIYYANTLRDTLQQTLGSNIPTKAQRRNVYQTLMPIQSSHSPLPPFSKKPTKNLIPSTFYDLEGLGIEKEDPRDAAYTTKEAMAVKILNEKSFYDEDKKQWTAPLLWDPEFNPQTMLGDNLGTAIAFMRKVRARMRKSNRLGEVNKIFRDMMDDGFARELTEAEQVHPHAHYLPTVIVQKDSSATTKLRCCIHASCKSQTGLSLNDCLLAGPNLVEDIPSLLIRFRMNPYALVTDLSKMFWRILIREEDINWIRLVWAKDILHTGEEDLPEEIREEVLHLVFVVLAFGLKSAPYISQAIIRKHAEKFKYEYPLAAWWVSNFYLDDGAISVADKETAKKLAEETVALFDLASMPAQKFQSSDRSVLKDLPEAALSPEGEPRKVLGNLWLPKEDIFIFDFLPQPEEADETVYGGGDDSQESGAKRETKTKSQFEIPEKLTKRKIASLLGAYFDPCGLTSCVSFFGKTVMQSLWLDKNLTWDAPVSDEVREKWVNWMKALPGLKAVRIPRNAALIGYEKKWVAAFSDASVKGFATVLYLVTQKGKEIKSSLIFSKTKVKPVNLALTIPRLELCGLVLAAKCSQYVLGMIGQVPVICFTDSICALYWANGAAEQKRRLWLDNRIKQIHEYIPGATIRFCPGQLNYGADLASRGVCDAEALDQRWWDGPKFLQTEQDSGWWPEELTSLTAEQAEQWELACAQELKPVADKDKTLTFLSRIECLSDMEEKMLERISRWDKLINVTAYLFRFRDYKKDDPFPENLTLLERERAKKHWLRRAQRMSFEREIMALEDGDDIKEVKGTRLLQYNPYIDSEGLLRSESRLTELDDLPEATKRPLILPKDSHIVGLWVMSLHFAQFHAPPHAVWSRVKQEALVIGGLREIKRIIGGCPNKGHRKCQKPKLIRVRMGKLPPERGQFLPFYHTACDYFGPLYYRDGNPRNKEPAKCYGLLFICLSTRGIHLEVTRSQSLEEFYGAWTRFISRRGRPRLVWSDNSKTFNAATKLLTHQKFRKENYRLAQELQEVPWRELRKRLTERHGIQWKFIPPKTPFANGSAERAVGLCKDHIRRMLSRRRLFDLMEMQTLLAMCELVVNSRPLGLVVQAGDHVPVTPFELLNQRKPTEFPDALMKAGEVEPLPARKRTAEIFEKRRKAMAVFWNRWTNDYLTELSTTKYWQHDGDIPLKEGDAVFIREKELPVQEWLFGVVEKVNIGRDSYIDKRGNRIMRARSARIRTNKGTIVRSIRSLAFLEDNLPNQLRGEMEDSGLATDADL